MKRIALAAIILLAGCATDAGNAVHSGTLTLSLVGGGTSDGALVIVVSGGAVTSVGAPASYQVASNADGEGTHIMVVGNLVAGPIATIVVPDLTRASAYVVTVMQAADRSSFALLDAARYHVTIAP